MNIVKYLITFPARIVLLPIGFILYLIGDIKYKDRVICPRLLK